MKNLQLTKRKIVKYVINDGENIVDLEWGEKIRNWIKCVYNSK
jgi:hypothetical protein